MSEAALKALAEALRKAAQKWSGELLDKPPYFEALAQAALEVPTLRAALSPAQAGDGEVSEIRARHEHCAFTVTKTEWNEREAFNAHADRATLLRRVDALTAELAKERSAC